ncbi:MAG TPA: phosphoribosyl-ATP diphosphatase [Rhizomicrobium sp.]|nr:phosphoribosyl-ATP diphosphatase [Rhizomicrobium sp.]
MLKRLALDPGQVRRSVLPMAHPIDRLFEVIRSRKSADPETSYTAKLFAQGTLKIAKKVGEEGVETALAGIAESDEALIGESADLLYHLLVLWAARGLEPEAVYRALDSRTNRSGLQEKASRSP